MVLDLDETLVHSESCNPNDPKPTEAFMIQWKNSFDNCTDSAFTRLRPGVLNFLKKATSLFEVVIFTASMPGYAKEVLKLLDKEKYHFYLLSRKD